MKILKKEAIIARNQVAHTKTERNILQTIDHPFIVQLCFAFQTADKLYLVMDFLNGGELFYHLKKAGRFSEERAKFYAAEIVLALEYLHNLGIIYRDLKPENILLDSTGHIKLTDFGLSKNGIAGDMKTGTFCGTPEYLAPEILRGVGHNKAVDWWSLGALLYEMLTGVPPFYSRNRKQMFDNILRGTLMLKPYHSTEARSLLQGLLNRNASKRLGSGNEDAEEIKRHPFFRGVDFEKMQRREIPAPFKPHLLGNIDVSNFDTSFTNEPVVDSPVESSLALTDKERNRFTGFTYVPSSDHMNDDEDDKDYSHL
eukprot:GILI01010975.1.p1 GENE.GILI01010975.1~~GILI01010975.1.p1  ORF type:complete len:345 (+),score=81.06 GILI01010975.1:98-1036(+)